MAAGGVVGSSNPAGRSRTAVRERCPQTQIDDLYRDHFARLRRLATRMLGDESEAEDVAQETLVRAWRHQEALFDHNDLGPWLTRVARNLCVDVLRRRRSIVPVENLPDTPDPRAEVEAAVDAADERREVRHAIARLEPRHREVLYLREVKGIAYQKLASTLGVSEVATRMVLSRARRALRKQFEAVTSGAAAFVMVLRVRLGRWARRGSDANLDRLSAPVLQGASLVVLASQLILSSLAPPVTPIGSAAAPRENPHSGSLRSERSYVRSADVDTNVRPATVSAQPALAMQIERGDDELAMRAGARNPITGKHEFASARVWRDYRGEPSRALSVTDAASTTVVSTAKAPEAALDDLVVGKP